MGFVVLHMEKSHGTDTGTTAHIERAVTPSNSDPLRTDLNKELVELSDGMNRTQAIQHRLETAGLKRKIGKNQVRAIRINLSGSSEDMQFIQSEGRLDEWCEDSMKWLGNTFGKENIVSAVLHLDETTPHIHATLVPIVTGERRKAKDEETKNAGKKKYKKKNTNAPRLCADDVMTRIKLKEYQDTYALAMAKYGLQRGINGSEARHTTTQEYYRELFTQKDTIAEKVEYLKQEQEEVREMTWDLYDRKDEAREKFLNLHEYTQQKETEISEAETRLEQLRQDYEPYKAQDDINLLLEVMPTLSERLRIAQLCKGIGLAVDAIKQLFSGESVSVNGMLHSPEHNQDFKVQDAKLQIFKEQDNSDKLLLKLNGQNIIDWFNQKYQEVKQVVRPHIRPAVKPEINKGKGFKM